MEGSDVTVVYSGDASCNGKFMIIVWHWRDLRTEDNPALAEAVATGLPVLPLYIHEPSEQGEWSNGGATSWWLGHSLAALAADYERRGATLHVRSGSSYEVLNHLVTKKHATHVVWNRRYEPLLAERDAAIAAELELRGVHVRIHEGNTLGSPTDLKPYKVFTPFYKALRSTFNFQKPLKAPEGIRGTTAATIPIADLDLPVRAPWASGWSALWTPGSAGAAKRVNGFLGHVDAYDTARDILAEEGGSRLSPHLHFGEISPRQIAWALKDRPGVEPFLRQLIWREFAFRFLFNYPNTPSHPWREEFSRFPWKQDTRLLKAWQQGRTGYPIVDAGMRELWQTGWMHNRARMIVASFLVKDLLIPWQQGARWFWDTLVDADLANNTFGWQWSAGCGADAAPYFRIFNPVLQGKRFDPDGTYVRRYVPELRNADVRWIHEPWNGPGVPGYPAPIVDHKKARDLALKALSCLS